MPINPKPFGDTGAKVIFGPELRVLVFIGFLGGFTTFSTFGYELLFLVRNGQAGMAAENTVLQLALGLPGVWGGFSLTKRI